MRKDFAKFLKPHFVDEFGENGRFLNGLSETELRKKLENLNFQVNNDYLKQMKEGNLTDFSPWLNSFKRNPAKDLEIPGKFNLIIK